MSCGTPAGLTQPLPRATAIATVDCGFATACDVPQHASVVTFAKNEIIFHEGDLADGGGPAVSSGGFGGMFFIAAGSVDVLVAPPPPPPPPPASGDSAHGHGHGHGHGDGDGDGRRRMSGWHVDHDSDAGAALLPVACLHAGDYFGEIALLEPADDARRTSTVQSHSAVTLLHLSPEAFEDVAARMPRFEEVVAH